MYCPKVSFERLQYLSTSVDDSRSARFLANFTIGMIGNEAAGPEVIKLFSCSTQLSLNFSPLIHIKMPTIVGILTCMSGKKITF